MKPEVYIRADGSAEIGLGHLVRCIALACMLREEFDITFICRQIPEGIKEELSKNNFRLQIIDDESSFMAILKPEHLVILDGYSFFTGYQKQIKSKGCKLVCIDDLHDQKFEADLIINHAPGVKPKDYKAKPYTKFALGLEYALVRSGFLEQSKTNRVIKKIETIIICFGGADSQNLTKSILSMIREIEQFKRILVVTGSGYQFTESLKSAVYDDNRIEYFQSVDEDKMLNLMLQAELAIVPASSISIEILHVGLIMVTGFTIENQKNIYGGLVRMDNVYGIGDFSKLDFIQFKILVQEMLNSTSFPVNLKTIKHKPLNLLFNDLFDRK